MRNRLLEHLPLLMVAAFAALLPVTKMADPDLFFHLRLGEYIWENKALYWTDGFSYTSLGSPQKTGEWLSNLLIYAAYKLGGFVGLGLLKSALFLLVVVVLYRALRTLDGGGGTVPIAASLLVFAHAVRFRLDLRPHCFTYVFLAAFMLVLLRYRAKGGGLFLLPSLQVLWSNTHGADILGPMLVGLFVATETLKERRFRLEPLAAFALVLAASWLTPELMRSGGAAWLGRFDPLAGEGARELGEWQPITADLLWGFGMRYTLGYQVLVAGAALFLIMEATKKRFDLFHIVLFAASVIYPMKHVRLIPVAAVLLMPMFYGLMKAAFAPLARASLTRAAVPALLCAVIVLLAVQSVFRSQYYSFGFGPKEEVLHDKALRFLDENGIGGNGFNTVTVGSYMLWQAPHRKPFIDGRLVQPPHVQDLYERAIKSAEGLKEIDRTYGLNYVILDYDPKSRWRFPLHINSAPEWALLYWDRSSAVYVKNNDANAGLIRERGYRLLRPHFDDFSYLDPYLHSQKEPVLALIDEDIKRNPALQDPYLAKAYVSYYFDLKEKAGEALQRALGLPPDTAFEHLSMAQLLVEDGRVEEAAKEARAALRLDPGNAAARQLLKTLGE